MLLKGLTRGVFGKCFLTLGLLIVVVQTIYSAVQSSLPCTDGSHVSPINIAPPYLYQRRQHELTVALNLTLNWKPCSSSLMYRFDDSSMFYYGDFGGFRLDTREYKVVGVYVLRGSAHLYEGKRFPAEINIKGKSSSGATATLVTFLEYHNSTDYDEFFYSLGFGRGEIKKMYAGSSAKLSTEINLFDLTAQPLSSDSMYHYMGTSMFDTCELSHYVFFKSTQAVHKDQLEELLLRPKQLPLYPIRVNIYTSEDPNPEPNNSTRLPNVKPLSDDITNATITQVIDTYINRTQPNNTSTSPNSTKNTITPNTTNTTNTSNNNTTAIDPSKLDQPNPAEPISFNNKHFSNLYSPYPPPRNQTPPAQSEEYPAEEFPYPDAWPWTGEPNYPNDPWYPEYYFPEQKVFGDFNRESPRFGYHWPNNNLPKEWPEKYWPEDYYPKTRPIYYPNDPEQILLPFSEAYGEPKSPEHSSEWPHGYPIWPSAASTVPIFPQNADFFPRVDDPYYAESLPRKPQSKPEGLLQGKELDLTPEFNYSATLPKPTIGLGEDNPTRFLPRNHTMTPRHPELTAPVYSYPKSVGNSTYPKFPRERWPDNPFNPKLYPGYPQSPSNDLPPTNPKDPSPVKDPKVKWPQNPYFTWPDSKHYRWPKDNRFESPASPEEPTWYFPKDPTKDPKWRRPVHASVLPKPIGQRTPEDPVKADTPIVPSATKGARIPLIPSNSTNSSNQTNTTNNTTLPLLTGYDPNEVKKQPEPKKPEPKEQKPKPKYDPFGNLIPQDDKGVESLPAQKVVAAAVVEKVVVPQDNLGYHPANRIASAQNSTANQTNSSKKKDTPALDPNQVLDPFGNPIPMAEVDMKEKFRDPTNYTKFSIPNISTESLKDPAARPGYSYPDPAHLVMPPHGRSPFPIDKEDVPRTYKGIPNQPFGLMPPNALPAWEPLNPKLYTDLFRSPPPAPPGSKWINYFYYPIPHSSPVTSRVAVIPQYILVPDTYMLAKAAPTSIPILIFPDQLIKNLSLGQPIPTPLTAKDLRLYNMPVIRKPVDPTLRDQIQLRDITKKVLQARSEKNAILHELKYDIEDFKVPMNQRLENIAFDRSRQEIIGFDVICDEWKIGVLVNRHFIQAFEWGYSGDNIHDFDEGRYRYCAKWHEQPRFKGIPLSPRPSPPPPKPAAPAIEIKVNPPIVKKPFKKFPCDIELYTVINDRNLWIPKRTRDLWIQRCKIWLDNQEQADDFHRLQDKTLAQERAKHQEVVQLAMLRSKPQNL